MSLFLRTLECFLSGVEVSVNLVDMINHWSMNCAQFKDFVSHKCLADAGLLHERWQVRALFYYNDKYFCHWIRWIQWKDLEKTPMCSFWIFNYHFEFPAKRFGNSVYIFNWKDIFICHKHSKIKLNTLPVKSSRGHKIQMVDIFIIM